MNGSRVSTVASTRAAQASPNWLMRTRRERGGRAGMGRAVGSAAGATLATGAGVAATSGEARTKSMCGQRFGHELLQLAAEDAAIKAFGVLAQGGGVPGDGLVAAHRVDQVVHLLLWEE